MSPPLLSLMLLSACGGGDPFERHPGLLESAARVETHGRLVEQEYVRHGLGEGGGDVYSVLSFDGRPVEIEGGHLQHLSFCETCDATGREAAAAILLHRDEAVRGLYVYQVVDGRLQSTRICPATLGLEPWKGMRYSEARCKWGYYDAEQAAFVDLRELHRTVPTLPLPDLPAEQLDAVKDALDLLVTTPVKVEHEAGKDWRIALPQALIDLLPLGPKLTPFVVARLRPDRPDEAALLVQVLQDLRATEATESVAVLRALLPDDPSALIALQLCNRFLTEISAWP